jgi:branched-chain amino acid transport system ATP-binding protein
MTHPLISTNKLVKRFGGLVATDDVSLRVEEGELRAVIGPNGAGKTTLLAQLAGDIRPSSGAIEFAGEDITALAANRRAMRGIARSFQVSCVLPEFTVLENVLVAVQARAGRSLQLWKKAMACSSSLGAAQEVLADVGLGHRANIVAGTLAHGEKRMLEIAVALAIRPRLLLLDEPMAGLGLEDTGPLIEFLGGLKRTHTIVLIEHDMNAVFALADRVTVLLYGREIATGTVHEIQNNNDVRRAYLGACESG